MEQLDLSAFFKTKPQANDFTARIATIAEQVFQTDFNLDKALAEQFGMQKKDMFLTLLRESNVPLESNSALKDFLTKLQQETLTLPVLSLTVAFEPKEQTLKAISEWFLMNMHKQILLDITVDPSLVGGATIAFKGKFLDFSAKSTFEKMLKETAQAMTSAPGLIPVKDKSAPVPQLAQHQSVEHLSLGR